MMLSLGSIRRVVERTTATTPALRHRATSRATARPKTTLLFTPRRVPSARQVSFLWTRPFSTDTSAISPSKREQSPRRRRASAVPATSKRHKELALLVDALRLFYDREGHYAVPIAFDIPRSTAWPLELRSLALGIKTHKLMHHIASGKPPKGSDAYINALESFGFPVYTWRQYMFDTVLIPALTAFARLEGDLFVPQKFVVPHGDVENWPKETWGYALGLQVAKLRRDKRLMEDEDIDALNAIGFVWNVRDAKWYHYFLPGLRLYKELHGHADVPLAFEIPRGDDAARNPECNLWPKYMWGYRLGRHVYMVRSGKYAEHVQQSQAELESLGFSFGLSESLWTYTIFPALDAFAHVHGHCDVPQDFVVPAEDPWPESAYGWRLGHTVKSIRHQGVYEDQVRAYKADLERIAFVWNATDRVEVTVRRIVIPAMKAYQKLHGDVLISTDFVVPDQGTWPTQAYGFRLGHWITRVRSGQIELPRALREELDNLGFVWRFNDERWDHVLLPSFRAYADQHGSCKGMSNKFIVPYGNTAYPKRAWGVNLGGAVWHMKNGDTYIHDPVKERELKRLGVL